jgi:hypothetical protein
MKRRGAKRGSGQSRPSGRDAAVVRAGATTLEAADLAEELFASDEAAVTFFSETQGPHLHAPASDGVFLDLDPVPPPCNSVRRRKLMRWVASVMGVSTALCIVAAIRAATPHANGAPERPSFHSNERVTGTAPNAQPFQVTRPRGAAGFWHGRRVLGGIPKLHEVPR